MDYDAGDEGQVNKRKTKAQLQKERNQEELRQILATSGGRYWIWRLLEYCGVFKSMSDELPHMMAIRSGLRDAGLWTLSEILEVDSNILSKMRQEAKDRK